MLYCQHLKDNSQEEEAADFLGQEVARAKKLGDAKCLGNSDSILSFNRVETVGKESRSATCPVWSTTVQSLTQL